MFISKWNIDLNDIRHQNTFHCRWQKTQAKPNYTKRQGAGSCYWKVLCKSSFICDLIQGLKQCREKWSFSQCWLSSYPCWLSELYHPGSGLPENGHTFLSATPARYPALHWFWLGHTPICEPVSVAKRMQDSDWSGPPYLPVSGQGRNQPYLNFWAVSEEECGSPRRKGGVHPRRVLKRYWVADFLQFFKFYGSAEFYVKFCISFQLPFSFPLFLVHLFHVLKAEGAEHQPPLCHRR